MSTKDYERRKWYRDILQVNDEAARKRLDEGEIRRAGRRWTVLTFPGLYGRPRYYRWRWWASLSTLFEFAEHFIVDNHSGDMERLH